MLFQLRALLLLDLRGAADYSRFSALASAGLKCHTDYRRARPVQRSDPVVSAFNSVPSLSSSAVHTSMYFFVASRQKELQSSLTEAKRKATSCSLCSGTVLFDSSSFPRRNAFRVETECYRVFECSPSHLSCICASCSSSSWVSIQIHTNPWHAHFPCPSSMVNVTPFCLAVHSTHASMTVDGVFVDASNHSYLYCNVGQFTHGARNSVW